MEFLIGGVAVVIVLGVFFSVMKARQARRFEAIGGAAPGPYRPEDEA